MHYPSSGGREGPLFIRETFEYQIEHQIEQEALQRIDQKVLYRIRHNKALKVRCSNQFHLDQLLEKIRFTGGNDAMQPENEGESSDDDFW